MTQASIGRGRRMSTARCYLDPARVRPNLTVETDAMGESLILEGDRCVGVRYAVRGEEREARAAREVIVSAGSHRLAAAAGALRHRPGGAPQGARHRGAPRSAGRRRESARPLGAAHEVARRPSRRDLQRACTRRPRPVAGPPLHHRAQGLPQLPGLADARLLQDPRGPRQPGRHAHGAAVPDDAEPEARQAGWNDHHHASAASREQGQRARDGRPTRASRRRSGSTFWPSAPIATACSPACGPCAASSRPRRSPGSARRSSRPAPRPSPTTSCIDFVTRTAETTYHPVGTCKMGSDAAAVVDDRLRVQRHLRIARRRCLDHADADLGQHQRAVDHDRREGGAHGAGGRCVTESRRSVRRYEKVSSTISPGRSALIAATTCSS